MKGKNMIEEIFSLMKELTGKTSEVSQSQGIGTKIDGERKEQSSSVAQTLGIKTKFEEEETQEEGQTLTEKEEDRKKNTRKWARKRSRRKGRCESEERKEKEV